MFCSVNRSIASAKSSCAGLCAWTRRWTRWTRWTWLGLAALLTACNAPAEPGQTHTQASAEPSINWRLTSTYPSSLPLLGSMGKRIEVELDRLTNGEMQVKFHEPGVLAPPFETFDAVSYGAVEAGWGTAGYWAGKVPALQLFSSMPFGPSAGEYLAWFDYGGGRALYEALYHRHDIHPIICGLSPPEAAGWFREPIHSIEDFRGLKIRFFGLGSKVLEKVGASPQLIAGGEIFQALELGTIDATEYSMPSVDYQLGFHEVAKYYYFPGWHQQSSLFELMINLDVWNTLSTRQKAVLETVCAGNIRFGLSSGEAAQTDALAKIAARGVQISEFDPATLAALKTAWLEVAQDLAASDPDFRRVWESLEAFRRDYAGWSARGYLKP